MGYRLQATGYRPTTAPLFATPWTRSPEPVGQIQELRAETSESLLPVACRLKPVADFNESRGFTLLELMIVIAIIGLVATAVVPALNAVTGANARGAAGEIAGSMRYLFDTARLRHQTCRLAFDLDNQAWWAECTQQKFFQAREEERAYDGHANVDDQEVEEVDEDDEKLAERFPDEQDAEKRKLLAKAKFGQFTDRQMRKRELKAGSAFTDIWTQHQRDPYSKGLAYVYFYPMGQAEAAQVPITDGKDFYTVVLQPFTGHAKVVSGKPEVPRS